MISEMSYSTISDVSNTAWYFKLAIKWEHDWFIKRKKIVIIDNYIT